MPQRERKRQTRINLLLLFGLALIMIAILGWQHGVLIYD